MTTGSRARNGCRWWAANDLRRLTAATLAAGAFLALQCAAPAHGAKRQYEAMSDSVRSSLRTRLGEISEGSDPPPIFTSDGDGGAAWLTAMSARMARLTASESPFQDDASRRRFLAELHYEASRAGLNPQLMLAVAEVESSFRKYAVSRSGARGLMQIMPFWTREIGDGDPRRLFETRANLRYGAVILRHYLDLEDGDLVRALARYNGSAGSLKYPRRVLRALQKNWQWKAAP